MAHLANHDALTDLPNRAAFNDQLSHVLSRAAAAGLWAVGFVGYDAAPAFDAALAAHPPAAGPAPLAAFSIFASPEGGSLLPAASPVAPRGAPSRRAPLVGVRASLEGESFKASIERVREAIAAGSTYQVNLSFPFHGSLSSGGPTSGSSSPPGAFGEELLAALLAPGEAPYAALLEGERWAIVSLSPELFFARADGRVVLRPMKGTRARGRFGAEDRARAAELARSRKDRAENLMIVDMIRNDLGRVARPGTVAVERAFAVERYPTVWQMTSTVAGESDARLPELFAALFPCASVTGAPKPATTRFIRDLEAGPRGVYCGAIGRVEPGGRARFAVAIRTLEVDRAGRSFRYGVGSGITWDSDAEEEWRECLAKAAVLDGAPPEFELLETMRWRAGHGEPGAGGEPGARGVALLDLHLERLAASAEYFGFEAGASVIAGGDAKAAMEEKVRALLDTRCSGLAPGSYRLRLRLARSGALALDAEPFRPERKVWRVTVAPYPAPSLDVFAFHKTTWRGRYEAAAAAAAAAGAEGVDEVLLVNERGELTEGTRTNVALQLGGEWLTPPLDAGLLPGVFRAHLLRSGRLVEATLYPEDLRRAHRVRLMNALRGWIPAAVERP
ncbi:MAG: aminodeoxychorismate synthase, component I [Thermoanaerobaculia bacterium]|nr:MAG: aminodeoxychorismate synthase, component I [Thermoanaerobaculia bacterium]